MSQLCDEVKGDDYRLLTGKDIFRLMRYDINLANGDNVCHQQHAIRVTAQAKEEAPEAYR